MKLTPYWLDTSEPFDKSPSASVEGRYDVAVVGGGITGASAALALAKKGARVAVLEAATIGSAASGRNGGMCNNGFALRLHGGQVRQGKGERLLQGLRFRRRSGRDAGA
ncbi:MAG: FAD-dependent oxidoreductase [Maritimibacter sp.]